MSALDWLTARPFAHRGLHDAQHGIIENTASAFSAAISNGYGIECDVQISADGEAMVHHDGALGRLTDGDERLAHLSADTLKKIRFKNCSDHMLSLGELCDLVAGRVTLLIELKSHFDGDDRLVRRVSDVLKNYRGPAAAMSFDPDMIVATREIAPHVTRGVVAERYYLHDEWGHLSTSIKRKMASLLHAPETRPQFIAYSIADLPATAPLIARHLFGLPLLTWTVRNDRDRLRAERWADQIIFEGWRP